MLENVGNLISEKASAKGLELIFDIEPSVSTQLQGDPLRLGQILINFCSNAVKFTDAWRCRRQSSSARGPSRQSAG